MTEAQRREAARKFYQRWHGKGKEDEDCQLYWLDILQKILGASDATDRVDFEKKVIVDGHTKRIDCYIPETKTLIEQKSLSVNLDKKIHQSGGIELTPYEQAVRYNNGLKQSEKAKWIVISNFAEIRIYDMDTAEPEKSEVKIIISNLQAQYSMLDFLLKKEVKTISEDVALSKEAGTLVGKIYDAFLKKYHNPEDKKTLESLNILCVRIVFCLYAEDAGLFDKKDSFSAYLQQYEPKDMRTALVNLFRVLNTNYDDRKKLYFSEELEAFPYCNGGLFDREIEIPNLTQEIKDVLITASQFSWKDISPTIFGAVFESTLNPDTRRKGGMHYTSIENIHKVIDSLFLDDLKAEFSEILSIAVKSQRKKKLEAFQKKLSQLIFLDPSAGSGNFLTETYLSLRRLENELIGELYEGQQMLGDVFEADKLIKVSITQFYGIEINDFACDVAKTALWIAESQTMKETEDIIRQELDFLPLKTNASIHCRNALDVAWEDIVDKHKLNYIIGNPPFVGARKMEKPQKADVIKVFGSDWKNVGNLDYVSCWYKKASELMKGTSIRAALVSTNSVCQGEAVANLWKPLFHDGVHIDFAHRTFRWDNDSTEKARVHCVIIGFSIAKNSKEKRIYEGDTFTVAKNINGYLIDFDSVFIENRNKPICAVPEIGIGNKPIDGGFYLFKKEEMEEFIAKEPASAKWFKLWYGADEFISQEPRYCLWLGDCPPHELMKMPECMKRVEAVRQARLNSKSPGTQKIADTPTRFHVENMPKGTYVVIPEVSSEKRRYVPMGFMDDSVLCSNKLRLMPNASLYHFGVLNSNVHMAWMRAVCGRLESRYDYSIKIVYNNFPWPDPTPAQIAKIEETAKKILEARALHPDSTLANMYGEKMYLYPELTTAHDANNRAVMAAYGLSIKDTSEADCVAFLMKRYTQIADK